ncbi:MAG TPA: hypothetical protein VNJ01_18255 [Bacteriovoracaceae bacterium]|nr:hypothetical protein [Bacteriovoracaceae bacterium]
MKLLAVTLTLGLFTFSAFAEPAHKNWNSISVDWGYGEIEEGSCDSQTFKLSSKGAFVLTGCGETLRGKARKSEMKEVRSIMTLIMTGFHKKLMCDPENWVDDYSWNIKVQSGGLKARTVFSNTGSDQGICTRGATMELHEELDSILSEIAYQDEGQDH